MQADERREQNPATVWAEIMVDELARGGLTAVCIAPGSRSTALTLAFAAHPDVRVYSHLDERSAAFFALGMALFVDKPVAIVSTSGTATANFYPAIIEAKMSQVPLLVLTADRPPELRHSGANQTIDQVKLYGDQVLWAVDVALPQADAPPVALRNLRTLAARALARANGVIKGPVHLNFPFRKPFEPLNAEADEPAQNETSPAPHTVIERGVMAPSEDQLAALAQTIEAYPRGLIVCGPRCSGGAFPQAVAALSRQTGYPIFADPLSGVRFGPWVNDAVICGGYETYLREESTGWDAPQVVLRFGAVPTSKWLNAYLQRHPATTHIHVRGNGVWADDSHQTRYFLQADEVLTCRGLVERLSARKETGWQSQIQAQEQAYWAALAIALADKTFDAAFVADMMSALPAEALLFVGNSLPIRHVDQYAQPASRPLHVFANRGASGIDGNTSTALGLAAASGRPAVALLGDITFYHDMNGLLALRQHNLNLTIVVLNNNSGAIFRRLPVAAYDPPFNELFLTPHGLDFRPAAEMYGLEHSRVKQRDAFRELFETSMARPAPRLIEVCTDSEEDYAQQQAVVQATLAICASR